MRFASFSGDGATAAAKVRSPERSGSCEPELEQERQQERDGADSDADTKPPARRRGTSRAASARDRGPVRPPPRVEDVEQQRRRARGDQPAPRGAEIAADGLEAIITPASPSPASAKPRQSKRGTCILAHVLDEDQGESDATTADRM